MNSTSTYIFISFIVASLATLGSLFFSEIMEFIPCSMCWYQRIFMYPLVIIFLVNMLYPDDKIVKYAMPITLVGWAFSVYHNLLMFEIIPESIVPCVQGVPCSTEYINWLGFITIPFLSLLAYSSILVLLLIIKKGISSNEK
ncbi:disulfide oxidoreductase [Poseidonibacter ostreae]|uniref:Disulfide bond formation protein B n=1 Tax=Poseidonibacter ostreae TaxID=2654171 RepID=A0A6L4WQA9_9BACT|nr:disulfide oxidoreductase [Poseidonibacter ostreae]KAB7882991.1 disulfide bond formation protein B [Poseidonibacter ostreae]KAB7886641.1 disulfide bond formation protein B [Poseidonibacter ostreae]KAB7889251.1 disulfide bond formation protein B [Poseidonibacter ostreae]MAC82632.1 disulfide bond formation protein B [Arcobacter sp.]